VHHSCRWRSYLQHGLRWNWRPDRSLHQGPHRGVPSTKNGVSAEPRILSRGARSESVHRAVHQIRPKRATILEAMLMVMDLLSRPLIAGVLVALFSCSVSADSLPTGFDRSRSGLFLANRYIAARGRWLPFGLGMMHRVCLQSAAADTAGRPPTWLVSYARRRPAQERRGWSGAQAARHACRQGRRCGSRSH